MSAHSNRDPDGHLSLKDGSRIAVIGGGPAGSLYSYFTLDMAARLGVSLDVDIYEPRDFSARGPKGCNMCGGIISESLVQMLATEGILLPNEVVQRGIEAYVLHTDVGSVRIKTPAEEKRIAAVYRGGGPLKSEAVSFLSFDGFLLTLAVENGANHRPFSVTTLSVDKDTPTVTTADGDELEYDLIVVAVGINSSIHKTFGETIPDYSQPRTTRTLIREYDIGEEFVERTLGDAMHLFLMNIGEIEFAAAIPKGSSVTLCLLGEGIGKELLRRFINNPEVAKQLPVLSEQVCGCSPKMSISAAGKPFRDRLIFVGDSCVSRLYKDGIGAAYRQAKAAAATSVFWGISKSDFEQHYAPTLDSIAHDNRFGSIIFSATRLIQRFTFAQRAVLAMVDREQRNDNATPRMSSVLWDSFTGSAPYRDIFLRTIRPAFWLTLIKHLIVSAVTPKQRRTAQTHESGIAQ
jgi:flavin-dependent dehydrogenase